MTDKGRGKSRRGALPRGHSNDRAARFTIADHEYKITTRGRKRTAMRLNYAGIRSLRAKINYALEGRDVPPVTIYDATGKPVATMDPETRERKPL